MSSNPVSSFSALSRTLKALLAEIQSLGSSELVAPCAAAMTPGTRPLSHFTPFRAIKVTSSSSSSSSSLSSSSCRRRRHDVHGVRGFVTLSKTDIANAITARSSNTLDQYLFQIRDSTFDRNVIDERSHYQTTFVDQSKVQEYRSEKVEFRENGKRKKK
uniref:Uncharacterized protein n=1 Tax=Vespula pensylvanica TaxID=30213 RepID=A0A834PI24_VESPE|nr:hypothetical protein H0235_001677 [Vespula pensylvanica]